MRHAQKNNERVTYRSCSWKWWWVRVPRRSRHSSFLPQSSRLECTGRHITYNVLNLTRWLIEAYQELPHRHRSSTRVCHPRPVLRRQTEGVKSVRTNSNDNINNNINDCKKCSSQTGWIFVPSFLGSSAFFQNCKRCHTLGAAPSKRERERGMIAY